jgi:hypothetical protein
LSEDEYGLIRRKETADAIEKLHQLQAQAKLWAAQTRITVDAEVKIFLATIDAINNQTGQIDKAVSTSQKRIEALLEGKKKLEAQTESRVPSSELRKVMEEKEKEKAKIEELTKSHQSALQELEAQRSAIKVCLCHTGRCVCRARGQ